MTVSRDLALLVSGASGSILAKQFAIAALTGGEVDALHLVVTGAAGKVLSHELGPEWASARAFRESLPLDDGLRARIRPYADSDLAAQIASGSHRLHGVIVLPCSAGMAGSLANGISRGLAQRVADVALKQRWPLLLGIRETPMSSILLENLLKLANAGAHIVPPLPAFYLKPDDATALRLFVDHYCLRLLDLLSIPAADVGLRWQG
ncbi:MAG: UbiX family flavin prenyltransferase [Acidobacteria bacterium]|nr:UbiX family flavin prenyltransferase [Acidobacteriota bacterium]